MNDAASDPARTAEPVTHALQQRVAELVSRMTLDEKIGQMSQVHWEGETLPDSLRADIAAGRIGSLINAVGIDRVNQAQRVAVEESRLGIPLLFGRDVIHGFRTVFPIPLGLAATWNPERIEEAARVSAREAAAQGLNWTFAPMLDVTRDPRWGRIAESPGEDPFLASAFATAMVRGFQGDDLAAPDTLAACAKHFAGYGASESGRDYNTTSIPENELRNVYLPPFQAAIEAGAATIMASFSDLNGVPASGNEWLMRDLLREEWGFGGMVVSDWNSIQQLAVHGLTADDRQSALAAVTAGLDMEMASTTYRDHLAGLVREGLVDESLVDASVAHVLRLKMRLGLFERPYAEPVPAAAEADDRHRQAARAAALESLVLLKNGDDILPLDREAVRSVAVIGPLADSPHDQLGTWIFDGDASLATTPLDALEARDGLEVRHVRALETSRTRTTDGFPEALEAAQAADAVLLFLGEESILSGEAHSRADIRLPGAQQQLVHALARLDKPLIGIILAGRPLALSEVIDALPALVYAWHPGTEGGPAIADVLFGDASPSGKLPVSFPRMVGQVPIYYNHKNTGKPPGPESFVHIDDIPVNAPQTSVGNTAFHLDAGYTPLFPFGHGLTYGRFEYRDIQVSSPRVALGDTFEIRAEVHNTGRREATEVVQLYLRDLVGNVTRPVRELKGFQRVRLSPGERAVVRFRLTTHDLAFVGRDMTRIVEPGEFHAWIGGSSAATLQTGFELVAD